MEAYQMDSHGEVIDAGIDYISLTMLNDNPSVQAWHNASTAYLQQIAAQLGEMNETRRLGYEGFTVGGSFVGRRERDTIAIYSGERAKLAFERLYRRDTHVSRLDVQVSFRFNVTTNNVAQVARNSVSRANAKISGARQRNATLMEDLRGGATCYVGTRTSEQFARIYNKDAESGKAEYERVWRFEVQLKNKLAVKLAEQIAGQTYTSSNHALVFVKQWLAHRGVSTPWKADAELLPLPKVDKPSSQNDEKLLWLRTQVRPAIRSLLKYGLRDAILEALGLDEPIS
jgi:DNA relaxase NicK